MRFLVFNADNEQVGEVEFPEGTPESVIAAKLAEYQKKPSLPPDWTTWQLETLADPVFQQLQAGLSVNPVYDGLLNALVAMVVAVPDNPTVMETITPLWQQIMAIAQFPPDVREAWQDRARQYNLPQQFIDNI